ncbi:MAG: hypothetical protein ACE3JP_05470 [Ectobacillus sp.]
MAKIDGGLWANNPVLVGIAEAIKLGYLLYQIEVLSLGTGEPVYFNKKGHPLAGGLMQWMNNLIDLAFQSQSKGSLTSLDAARSDLVRHMVYDIYIAWLGRVPTAKFSYFTIFSLWSTFISTPPHGRGENPRHCCSLFRKNLVNIIYIILSCLGIKKYVSIVKLTLFFEMVWGFQGAMIYYLD